MRMFWFFICFWFFPQALANVGGSDLQNFNPTTSGLGFITVQASQTLQPGQFNVGSFLTYTTNSLAYSTVSSTPNNQSFTEPNDKLLYSNLSLGVGLMRGWEMGISAGFINSQNIDESNFLFSYGDTGINDIRLHTKLRLYSESGVGFAILSSVDFDQIKNNPFVGDNPGATFNLEAAADIELTDNILWAVNVGYRIRQAGTPIPNTGVTPLSDQWLYSSGLSYQTDDKGSAIIGEFYGSYPIEQTTTPTDRELSNLEFLIGYRLRHFQDIDIHGGLGTEAYQGLGSPDIRIYLGLNWRLNFLAKQGLAQRTNRLEQNPTNSNDSDNDGVPDPIDQCDNTFTSDVDERGCPTNKLPEKPEPSQSSGDTDGDGVIDIDDRCPQTSPGEDVNQFGCAIRAYE